MKGTWGETEVDDPGGSILPATVARFLSAVDNRTWDARSKEVVGVRGSCAESLEQALGKRKECLRQMLIRRVNVNRAMMRMEGPMTRFTGSGQSERFFSNPQWYVGRGL